MVLVGINNLLGDIGEMHTRRSKKATPAQVAAGRSYRKKALGGEGSTVRREYARSRAHTPVQAFHASSTYCAHCARGARAG